LPYAKRKSSKRNSELLKRRKQDAKGEKRQQKTELQVKLITSQQQEAKLAAQSQQARAR